jgi:hypothetical protein
MKSNTHLEKVKLGKIIHKGMAENASLPTDF